MTPSSLRATTFQVVVYFRQTYRHERTGKHVIQTGLKMYEIAQGEIVRFWGETDLYGLQRQIGNVPSEVSFD